MKTIITYIDGSIVDNLLEEDVETALRDIKSYTEKDRNNPYSIKSIEIIVFE